jgi:site-specific DNA-methyltransferase (adenine-specific)
MSRTTLPLNQIIHGNCIDVLASLPEKSVDLIFADPPYNLQLKDALIRPDRSSVDAVMDEWDKFSDFEEYDAFTEQWLSACQRVLKDDGTIWVIGSYHNIYRVGRIMMDLGYWILNDVIWEKRNPMPNFRGTRYTNATETMIWAQKSREQKRYTFNYHAMKNLNDEKQMTNVWQIPICTGAERIKIDGRKAHSTQKPEALLYRVILSSSNPHDVILDPFFGSGTTGAVAKKLNRHFIGIEREPVYIDVATARINAIIPTDHNETTLITPSKRKMPRVSFGTLVENGYIAINTPLYSKNRAHQAHVHADGGLIADKIRGSIHKVAVKLTGQESCNGWDFWHFENEDGKLTSIDILREKYRNNQ